MSNDDVQLEITQREAKLIIKYGYPFPDHQPLFESAAKREGISLIEIDSFWLEQLLGDLCRSIREVKSASLQEELNEICDSIEWELKNS